MLIDSHCHLNFNQFDPDRAEVVRRAVEEGVIGFINPSVDLQDSRQVVALATEMPTLYAAIGFHPNDAAKFNEEDLAELRDLATHPKVVAIGEIGLDYHWDSTPRPVQRHVFEQHLNLARELGKPVIIHQREAAADTMAMLRSWAGQHPKSKNLGVLHSFSGDVAMAEEAVALGFYLGISGPVTFKNARDLPAVVTMIPLNRLLGETDAPFLAPQPFRGKRNEPAHLRLIAEKIAALRHISFVEVSDTLLNNTISLFNLE